MVVNNTETYACVYEAYLEKYVQQAILLLPQIHNCFTY